MKQNHYICKKIEKMKKTLLFFMALYIILYPGCVPNPPACDPGLASINHVWTCTEGSELNSNGYYLDYPDGLVTTSTNTINYMPGDDGWFDGLTINFKTDGNYFISGSSGSDCGAQTTHDWDGVLERIYDFNGIYDTTIENYVVNAGGIIDWNGYDEQPNIQITGDGYSHVLKVMDTTEDYLELFKSQMDTFTNWWDPLNDTVYWSKYEETRKYSR